MPYGKYFGLTLSCAFAFSAIDARAQTTTAGGASGPASESNRVEIAVAKAKSARGDPAQSTPASGASGSLTGYGPAGRSSPDDLSGLWIVITNIDWAGVHLVLLDKDAGMYCQWLGKTNLEQQDWILGQVIADPVGPKDDAFFPVPMSDQT